MHQNFPHMIFLSIITRPSSKTGINLRNLPPAHSRGAVTFLDSVTTMTMAISLEKLLLSLPRQGCQVQRNPLSRIGNKVQPNQTKCDSEAR